MHDETRTDGNSDVPRDVVGAGLLRAKLNMPPRVSTLIHRANIVQRVQAGVAGRLTLVSAPPGFGKTMLAVAAFSPPSDELPVAWYTLDEGDNDLRRFLLYFISALENSAPGILSGMARVLESAHAPPEAALVPLANRLLALPRRVVLVLDDYHVIQTQAIHDALTLLLEQSIPTLHLVLLTRADPPLALGRLRAQGALTEIRAQDLRFDLDETRRFVHDAMQIPLPDSDLAILAGRTEGWIAGLHLAALSLLQLQRSPDPSSSPLHQQGAPAVQDVAARRSAFIRHFHGTHRHIIEYLSEEVLAQLVPADRDFILRTAILPRFTASLCAYVLGDDESVVAVRLRRLVDANLFLLPLDETHTWFRYHHLFGDLLQATLHQEMDASTLAHLYARAAEWSREHGDWNQAVEYAFSTDDIAYAVEIVGYATSVLFSQGELSTVMGWLQRLPDAVVRGNFYLALIKGWILLFARQSEQAMPYLHAARELFSPELGKRAALQLAHLEAQLALARREWVHAIDHTQWALAQADNLNSVLRGALLLLQAEAQESLGDLRRALVSYEAAATAMSPEASIFAYFGAQSALAFTLNGAGRRREAWQVAHRAWQELQAQEFSQQPIAGFILVALGRICFEANELDRAAAYLRPARALVAHMPVHRVLIDGLMALARIEFLHGNNQTAETIHQTARQLFQDGQDAEFTGALETANHLVTGNLAAAQAWVGSIEPTLDPAHYETTRDDVYLACMAYWLARAWREPDAARADRLAYITQWLQILTDSAETGGRWRVLLSVHLLAAQVALLQGKDDSAQTHIHAALDLSAPEGYTRVWLDEGAQVLHYLTRPHMKRLYSSHQAFVEHLLSSSASSGPTAAGEFESTSAQNPRDANRELSEPLTPRELEVLHLVAQGLTNQEIARQLVLAVSTVKRHLANIFAKLAVNHRAAAIAEARKYDLLA